MKKRSGKIGFLPGKLVNEVEIIKQENNWSGQGSNSKAMSIILKNHWIGQEIERQMKQIEKELNLKKTPGRKRS